MRKAVLFVLFSVALGLLFWGCGRINNKDFQPLALEDATISWSVWRGNNSWPRDHLALVLEDSRGWQAAGLSFEHTDDLRKAEVIFMPEFTGREFAKKCGRGADGEIVAGCILKRSDSRRCYIVFLIDYATRSKIRTDLTTLLNHELGHCFLGSKHTTKGLMSEVHKEGTTVYPSPQELELVRQQIKNP